ncbi:helix-turn-helix transcriptional regulator [Desulfitobacterium chlororespirans]|uniref:Helix-turn-helix n=1 Tax=Desulfitobacterium chlororespirans DSM 11544 TaxID=1121395 RepID=A0A1M7UY76_9FIRM|nr:helix-turn-helix transcriptional regulator [Desulfitobacterium chlororespirans]SHN87991.1 Helix-turn-helix [Desulfitobacterium chlororespirans DSM 11544]
MIKSEPRLWLIEKRGANNQQEVASKAGIDRSFYSQIENGSRNPSVNTAKKIAKALNFEWTLFFNQYGGDRQQ